MKLQLEFEPAGSFISFLPLCKVKCQLLILHLSFIHVLFIIDKFFPLCKLKCPLKGNRLDIAGEMQQSRLLIILVSKLILGNRQFCILERVC